MIKIVFLRHAHTEKDPSVNASLWGLSDEGKKQAENICKLPVIKNVDKIYLSEERKTLLTVKPLIENKKEYETFSFFNEVKRGDKFLSDEDFEKEKIKQLQDLSYHAFNGESGKEALSRFKEGVDRVKEEGKTVLIVTHGTVLNLYFADLLGVYDKLPERWKKTDFCAYGVTENDIVVKDII